MAIIGSFDHIARRLIAHTSPTKRSSDFIAHLEQLDDLYGPKPGYIMNPVVLVEDNGPIHVSKASRAALDARKHWLTVEWLPKYAPETSMISNASGAISRHTIWPIRPSRIPAGLDVAIHAGVDALNRERTNLPLADQRYLCLARGRDLDVARSREQLDDDFADRAARRHRSTRRRSRARAGPLPAGNSQAGLSARK